VLFFILPTHLPIESDFEEKPYEELMNYELAEIRKIFPVGQVFEHEIAIDAALFSRHPDFWKLWKPFSSRMAGVHLTEGLWKRLRERLDSDAFPRFRCNLFIQYKRPSFITGANGKARRRWNQPYFRFDVDQRQQAILQVLEDKTKKNSIVVYACASFLKWKELWTFTRNHRLVRNSNFVRPVDLNGHDKYTFVLGGSDGFGYSDPRRVRSTDLIKEIDKLSESSPLFRSNAEFLTDCSNQMTHVMSGFPELAEAHSSLMQLIEVPQDSLAKSVISIRSFALLLGVSWSVVLNDAS